MEHVTHGITAYANGDCRCEKCQASWAAYHRTRRAIKRAAKPEPFYNEREGAVRVRLTSLGSRILDAAVARTGHDPGDIVERLLRRCGSEISFTDQATA